MILVDTSVWVDHLRRGNRRMAEFLLGDQVLCHPFVIGELACGHLKKRREILSLLQALPEAQTIGHDEALVFVETHRLMGVGVGWIDIHLLAAAVLSHAELWTFDAKLQNVAQAQGVALTFQ
jgi:predicted nucleic acid-binding protein